MTRQQLLDGVKAWGLRLDADPGKWKIGGLKRNPGGSFDDADLVRLLTEETEDVAGAFGARNVSERDNLLSDSLVPLCFPLRICEADDC
jgi:hypothetical protein